MQVRQGDVFLTKVRSVPKGARPVARDRGRVVLAYGEVTGHAHAIADPDVELLELAAAAGADRFLRVRSRTAVLGHEEHAAITLQPGTYRVRIQREWSDQDSQRVLD